MKRRKGHSLETRRKISQSHMGLKHTEESKRKISEAKKGRKNPRVSKALKGRIPWNKYVGDIQIKCKGCNEIFISKKYYNRKFCSEKCYHDFNKGENNHCWKGGFHNAHQALRRTVVFKKWREQVFERDDYTCQECGKRGCYIEAHHIKRFADYPELRFDIDNGLTLCKPCHNPTKGIRRRGG